MSLYIYPLDKLEFLIFNVIFFGDFQSLKFKKIC